MTASCLGVLLAKSNFTNIFPVSRGRCAVKLKNLENLIDFAISTEKRFLFKQLSKDTSYCPDIYTQTVLLLAEQDLRSAVPESFYLMSERFDWQTKGSSKSEISNFQVS